MQLETIWIKVKDNPPPKDIWILVDTPFCIYPYITAKWNGYDFISAVDDKGILNVTYYSIINKPNY